jgi:hypothetical protein
MDIYSTTSLNYLSKFYFILCFCHCSIFNTKVTSERYNHTRVCLKSVMGVSFKY